MRSPRLVLVAVVWAAHARAGSRDRAVSAVLIVLFGALVFFGIVVDAVHHLVFPGPGLRPLFTVLEDGGEMVVLSIIVAFVFAVALCGHRPTLDGRLGALAGARTPTTADAAR